MNAQSCPQPLSEERVAAYVRGELSPSERAEVEAAIDREPEWLEVVALLARDDAREARETSAPPTLASSADGALIDQIEREHAARLRPGTRLGRYEIAGPLGHGGMGVVYAAHDPELDRKVALKLLRGRDPRGQARLLREARALARLSDPRVIAIYDVGTFEGRVFLAMERLDGETLLAWRASSPRTWREVVATFALAGRGLAAAHAAGLVHRDFKPANVMLTRDGRVVVLDFGLAHALGDDDTTTFERSPVQAARGNRSTRPRVLGTPAYMAPEQRRAEACGPQADQFSFCVALFESLHGCLPPMVEVSDGRSTHPRAQGRIPGRIERLLARGLSSDPHDRHASMQVLVDALAATLRPRQRMRIATLSLAAVTVGVGWVSASWNPEPCSRSDRALADTWNPERAAAIRVALERSDRPWSTRVREEVDRRLQTHAEAWIAEHEATCRATRVEGVQSEAELDLRMHCLDRRRRSLHALLEVLEDADVETAARAVQATDALESVVSCRHIEAASAAIVLPEDPRERARAEAVFDRIARLEALREAARYDEAAAVAVQAVGEARSVGHAPTLADARLAAGWLYADRGEHEAAEVELREALHAAELGGHDEAVTKAFHRLAWVVGYKLARHDEGRELAKRAAAWSQRLERPIEHELARLRTLGWIEHEAGAPHRALEVFEEALALAEQLPDDAPWRLHERGLVLNGLGAAAMTAGDLDRAQQSFSHAAKHLATALGPDHPDVARIRNNVAALLRGRGKAEEARQLLAHNLEVFETTFGPEHPLVGQTLINVAVAELDLGRHADAERHADRAIEVLMAAHGSEHPSVAKAHTLRGDARIQLGRPMEAIEDLERALVLERQALGAEHPSVGIVESNLGVAYYDLGRHDVAALHQERALEILEESLGAEHPNLAFVIMSLGLTRRAQGRIDEALALFRRAETQGDAVVRHNALTRIGEVTLERGDVAGAIEHLEQALALQGDLELDPGFTGDTRLALARARFAAGDRQAARAEARAAIEAYRAGDDAEPEADARRWLAEHGG